MLKLDFYNFPDSTGTGNFLETLNEEKVDYVITISGESMNSLFLDGNEFLSRSKRASILAKTVFSLSMAKPISRNSENTA